MIASTNSNFISAGGRSVVLGSAGVAPYTYSVDAGGVGGAVNSYGIYTAPYAYGVDTITVTDSDVPPSTATLKFNVLPPLHLLAQIIQQGMNLSNGRVWIWNQKISAPDDDAIFIVLRELSVKSFASQSNVVLNQAQVQIDIESKDQSALERKEEIIMALKSQYSENQQSLNGFKIASLPTSFVNVAQLQDTKIPYRFTATLNFLYAKRIATSSTAYYDDLSIKVKTHTEQERDINV